eukprot:Sdes_comp9758_c0_seq1m1275
MGPNQDASERKPLLSQTPNQHLRERPLAPGSLRNCSPLEEASPMGALNSYGYFSGVEESESTGCLCSPLSPSFRYVVLVFICFLSFGSYFCYDNPAALSSQIMSVMHISNSQYTMLYSLYSWPNVVMCFCGGFLLDQVFGVNFGTIVFSALVCLGQAIVILGAFYGQFWVMGLGRFIFGCGGEVLAVAQNTHAVNWFKGKELNMVFGIQLSFSRIGSTINMNMMRPLFDAIPGDGNHKLGVALTVGEMLNVFSLLCGIILLFLNRRAASVRQRDADLKVGEKFNFKDAANFSASFWLLVAVCVFYYVAVFPFIGLAITFFETKFGLSSQEASLINSVVYILSACCSPIVGILVDRTGRNLVWVGSAILCTFFCHLAMAATTLNPWIPMVLMGISYSVIACALWPCVALIVPEKQIGSGYGIMQCFQNLGLALVSQLAGYVVDAQGYFYLEMMFSCFVFLAFASLLALILVDSRAGGYLNASSQVLLKMSEDRAVEVRMPINGAPPYSPSTRPRSPFELRNRYMSRLGISLPSSYRLCPLSNRSVLR